MFLLYAIFYYGAHIFFALMTNHLLVKRNFPVQFSILFLFIYTVSMFLIAHLFHFIFVEHTVTFTDIQSAYQLINVNDIPGTLFRFFQTLSGLWGGPWAVVSLLFIFMFFLTVDEEVKKALLDIFAVVFPFSLAICKLGCFSSGCCYGFTGTGFPFVHFSWVEKYMESYGKTLFPVQLLDALLLSINGLILVSLFRKRKEQGRLILWFIFMYALGRFFSEFARGDQPGTSILGLRLVQFVLIFAFALSVIMLVKRDFYFGFLKIYTAAPGQVSVAFTGIPAEQKTYRKFFIFTMILSMLIPFYLVVCIIPFCVNYYRYHKQMINPHLLNTIFRLFLLSALGLLTLSCYLLVSIFPFIGMLVVTIPAMVFIMNQLANWKQTEKQGDQIQ